jgi:hypothetical protein
MRNPDSDEAVRQRRSRGHHAGDHGSCDARRCPEAERVWFDNEKHLYCLAYLAELKTQGIDAGKFLGDAYREVAEYAAAGVPDGLQAEPDVVHVFRARCDIKEMI